MEKVIEIVSKLNGHIEFKSGFNHKLYFKTDGWRYYIYSGNEMLWDSDEYPNQSLEEIELHIKKEFNKYCYNLNRLKFEI